MEDNKQQNIEISVIVPVYNCEKYIEKCIESVMTQTFQNLELILVNDGSTDQSGVRCHRYAEKDHRIHVIDKVNGGGAGEARNVGVDAAKGEWIAFLDSDDYMAPKMLETLYTACTQQNTDVAICGYEGFIEGEASFKEPVNYEPALLENEKQIKDFFVEHYPEGLLGFPWNKLYRRRLIQEHHLRFPKMRRLEDGIFETEYFTYCERCVILSERLYHYKDSRQVELGKLPYDFYEIMKYFVEDYNNKLKNWGYEGVEGQREMISYFYNDFVCCLENMFQPNWGKNYQEIVQDIDRIREDRLMQQMLDSKADTGRYTILVMNAFRRKSYRKVWLFVKTKLFLKTRCSKLFYRLKRSVNQ